MWKPMGHYCHFEFSANEEKINQHFIYKSKLFRFVMWIATDTNL